MARPYGAVGFFGVAVQEIFFFERDGCELGVGADGAQGDELFYAGEEGGG